MKTSQKRAIVRWKVICWRWSEIVIYAVLGLLLSFPCARFVEELSDRLLAFSQAANPFALAVCKAFICVLLLAMVVRKAGMRGRHFRYCHLYPPAVVSVPLVLLALVFVLPVLDPLLRDGLVWDHIVFRTSGIGRINPPAIDWLAIGAGAATIATGFVWISAVVVGKLQTHRAPVIHVPSARLEDLPLSNLFEWLKSERAIDAVEDDYFGIEDRAKQVVRAIGTARPNTAGRDLRQTVVVQGSFGAGKTSAMNRVKALATVGAEKYVFADVNCWGFSSLSAQEHVLERAVEELSGVVDCLALRNVPGAYADAISRASSWIGVGLRLLHCGDSPMRILERFSPILCAIDARLVIVIEDTDRNGPDFDQTHIEAMLHRFREVERVSFVLTAGERSAIEFPKIAEEIVRLPSISERVALTIIDRVRKNLLETVGFIDPTATPGASQNRPDTLLELVNARSSAREIFSVHAPHWTFAIAMLLGTPRALKRSLGRFVRHWSECAGEVDIDELLMVTTLRETSPGVFSFLVSYFDEIQALSLNHGNELPRDVERRKGRTERLRQTWRDVLGNVECDQRAVESVVCELLPRMAYVTDANPFTPGNRCQSIRGDRGEIYLSRLVSERWFNAEVRDQEVLRALKEGNSGDVKVLGERFAESAEFAELVLFFENFSSLLEPNRQLQAASIAIRRMRPLNRGSVWVGDRHECGLLIKWLRRRNYATEGSVSWLETEVSECVPNALRDALTLIRNIGDELLDENQLRLVRERFFGALAVKWRALSVVELSRCFDRNEPYLLLHLLRLAAVDGRKKVLDTISEWNEFGPKLNEALRIAPEIIGPQVILAVSKLGQTRQSATAVECDEEVARALFGSDLPTVLQQLMAVHVEVDLGPYSMQVREDIKGGKESVAKLLEAFVAQAGSRSSPEPGL